MGFGGFHNTEIINETTNVINVYENDQPGHDFGSMGDGQGDMMGMARSLKIETSLFCCNLSINYL